MNSLYLCDVAEIFREGKLSNSRENFLMLFQSLLNVLHGTAHFSCAAVINETFHVNVLLCRHF